jgi:hypothetical protein
MIPLLVPVGLGLLGGYLTKDSEEHEMYAKGGGVKSKDGVKKRKRVSMFDAPSTTKTIPNFGKAVRKALYTDLKDFNINDLDAFERMQYDDMKKKNPSMSKEEILQILINNVEGDYSQLSPKLAKIAESK